MNVQLSDPHHIFLFILGLIIYGCTNGPSSESQANKVLIDDGKISHISNIIETNIEKEIIPGAVLCISQKGKEKFLKAYGWQDIEQDIPMKINSIFRLASMTKPITSVAIMILVENGSIKLDDPVSKYVKEFSRLKVMKNEQLEPLKRPITIKDLLTYTSGMASGFENSSSDQLMRRMDQNQFQSLEELVGFLCTIPLVEQPGTRFIYSYNSDVLARIVEIVSQQNFGIFLKEHIFDPLKMTDTYFKVPPSKQNQLSSIYIYQDSLQFLIPGSKKYEVFPRGNSGLVSTIKDYSHFADMLLFNGNFGKKQVLKEETISKMLLNYLPDRKLPFEGGEVLNGVGFGFGFAIDLDNTLRTNSPAQRLANLPKGSFWWPGGYRTYFWVDPENELTVQIFIQTRNLGHNFITSIIDLIYK